MTGKNKKKDNTVARNRRARHDYNIEDTVEAGLVLKGTEVKSLRKGSVSIQDSYVYIQDGEAFVSNMHISPYEQGNRYNEDPLRTRKLLLKKREILNLQIATSQKGYTLIPLTIYFKNGYAKMQLAVAKGKKLYDRRDDIAKKDAERRMRQHASEKYNA